MKIGTVIVSFTTLASFFSAAAVQAQTYRVAPEASEFVVHVQRAGFFKVLGHDHRIRVGTFTGTIRWDSAAPQHSVFTPEVDAASLRVADDELSDDDRNSVQTTMEAEALALSENPNISFTSARVEVDGMESGEHRLRIAGELNLRGIRRNLEISLTLSCVDGRRIARGNFELRSKEWKVPQISALGGSVKTKSELRLEFEIVAAPEN